MTKNKKKTVALNLRHELTSETKTIEINIISLFEYYKNITKPFLTQNCGDIGHTWYWTQQACCRLLILVLLTTLGAVDDESGTNILSFHNEVWCNHPKMLPKAFSDSAKVNRICAV